MKLRWIPIALLLFGTLLVFAIPTHRGLTVSFLDVGQGDSIFIQSPTGVQVLIDGGPDGSVLGEISRLMPFWDRSIDMVVETHPDKDHIAGLTQVFKRYEVGTFLEPGIPNTTAATKALVAAVKNEKGVNDVLARKGTRIMLGGSAYADILFPDQDVSQWETNTGSIVIHLVYGETSFLLNGDSPQSVEHYLVTHDAKDLKSTVLKAGHHGSKTSSSQEFLEAVAPAYGVFSRGCDNTYGHPAAAVVVLFEKLKIPTLDTCEEGTITFESDRKTLTVR